MGPLWVLAFRFTVSALLLSLFAVKKLRKMPKHILKGSIVMGVFLAAAYIVQTYGLKYTTPGKNAFLTTTYCVLVPFFSWAMSKKKPGTSSVLAGFICIAGLAFVSLGNADAGFNIGDILTLISGIFYAVQILLTERYVSHGDALSISAVEFTTGAVICWAGALCFESVPAAVPSSAWFSIAYLSVMCTAVCYFLQTWGMKYTSASTAAVLMCLESVFGTLISVLFFDEQLTPKLFIGFTLIFISVLISETNPKFLHSRKERHQLKTSST